MDKLINSKERNIFFHKSQNYLDNLYSLFNDEIYLKIEQLAKKVLDDNAHRRKPLLEFNKIYEIGGGIGIILIPYS